MTTTELWALVIKHQWVPLAMVVIGLVIRLLKSDTKIPVTIPPRARAVTALLLGVVAAGLHRVQSGVEWQQAIFESIVAALLAIAGHNVVIDGLRGGKEFNLPGLIIPGASPSPDKPPTIPPAPKPPNVPPLAMLALFVIAMGAFAGCTRGQLLNAADLLADKIKCAVANQDLPNEAIFAKCTIQPSDAPKILAIIGESRAAAQRAVSRAALARDTGAGTDGSDAGAPSP